MTCGPGHFGSGDEWPVRKDRVLEVPQACDSMARRALACVLRFVPRPERKQWHPKRGGSGSPANEERPTRKR